MATAIQRTSSNRLTKSDMEASRLVFVYVKDAKPKRKVAVPVPEGLLWQEFLHQVKTKLRLSGVKEIFLASSGQKVTGLEELQDIDELCVVEGPELAPVLSEAAMRAGSVASTSEIVIQNGDSSHKPQSVSDRHKVLLSPSVSAGSRADDEGKYRGRVHPLKRALQKLLPGWFAPMLPVTSRDAEAGEAGQSKLGPRRRRVRRGLPSTRTLLLLLAFASCVAMMLWFFLQSSKLTKLP